MTIRQTGFHLGALVVLATFVGGCTFDIYEAPKSAEEFRQYSSDSRWTVVERHDVARPFDEVVESWRQRSQACLEVEVNGYSHAGGSSTAWVYTYNPAVMLDGGRAVLQLQRQMQVTNMISLSVEPDDGFFILVADAIAVDRNTTRIELYRAANHDVLSTAVRSWASGESRACPDLSGI